MRVFLIFDYFFNKLFFVLRLFLKTFLPAVKFLDLGALFDNISPKEINLAILAIYCLTEAAVLFLEISQRAESCELVLKHRAKDADHPAPSDGIGCQINGRVHLTGHLGK